MNPMWLEAQKTGVVIKVLIQPKASKSEVVGLHGDPPRLKIRIHAPPLDGEANDELCRFLGKVLKVPRSHVELFRGQRSKMKDVFCAGLDVERVRGKLTP